MSYKLYSDAYLLSLPKTQIIELLRAAENNYIAVTLNMDNSVRAGMELAEKYDKAKELLELAVEDIRVLLYSIGEPMESINCKKACEVCAYNPECNCSIACTIHNGLKDWRLKEKALELINGEVRANDRQRIP